MLKDGYSDYTPKTKPCLGCKKVLPFTSEFFPTHTRRGVDGLRPRCRPCHREFQAQYRVKSGETRERMDRVPAGPFREWILRRADFYNRLLPYNNGAGAAELARRSGLSERRINEVLKRSKFVRVDIVDRALVNEGSTMLWEIYPELYE